MAIVVRCVKVPTLALCAVLAPALAAGADWSEQQLATAARCATGRCPAPLHTSTSRSLVTEVGPRSAGSSGDAAAVRWALNKLASLGFSNVRTPGRARAALGARSRRGHARRAHTAAAGRRRARRQRRHVRRRRRGPGCRSRFAGRAQRAARRDGRRQDRLHQPAHGAHARRLGLRRGREESQPRVRAPPAISARSRC